MDLIYKTDAEKLVRSSISHDPGLISWSKHCMEEMFKDDLIINDLINVLKSGKVRKKGVFDAENDEYIYRIETSKIVVVFKFMDFGGENNKELGIKLITCWRK